MTLLLAFALPFQAVQPADTVAAVRDRARAAEVRYERLVRSLAPRSADSGGGPCDEIVGRFCLTYDEGRLRDPAPEAAQVTDARREAIEALRLAFSYEPGVLGTAGPLVRYLVEDGRAGEGVPAARAYQVLTGDSVWGPLLLGFALHAAADDPAAERVFSEGLGRLPDAERRRILDATWVLSNDDRKRYGGADESSGERAAANAYLWRHSDPLYLTPGNERWAEHVARWVWSRLLAMTPRVRDVLRWGDDLDQLTVRYGVPKARTRTFGTVYREGSMVEHYDPDQLAFVQADILTRGPAPAPLPGGAWPPGEKRSRSGYAPVTVRRMVPLDHQATRFPSRGGVVLRVDGRFVADSVARGTDGAVETGLFVLDDADLLELEAVRSTAAFVADTVAFGLEASVTPGGRVYSLEALETGTRLAARSRYAIDIDPLPMGLAVSDPLIAEPWDAGALPAGRDDRLRPRASLVFDEGEEVGLYAEVAGLAAVGGESRYRVELSIREADRAAFPARALSWIGRSLGLSSERTPPRVAWQATRDEKDVAVIAVNLALVDLPAGLHAITVAVTDLVNGTSVESVRVVRVR